MTTPRFAHQPALDGLRGLAVLAVLAFHLRWSAASGGFLGVSFFFTLSGFLITSLLLAEHAGSGRLDLKAFYARRIRRLLPGQLLCLALAMVVVLARPEVYPGRRLASDAGWAASQLFNWHLLGDHRTYADLFGRQTSPLEHFWSLAVEEQIYLVFPVLMALFLARPAARKVGVAVLTLVIVVPTLLAGQVTGNTAYLATQFRMTEFAVGVAAALLLARWIRQGGAPPLVTAIKGPAGVVAGAALVAVVVATTLGSTWVYRGGLTAVAAAGAVVLLGTAGATRGPARLLAAAPLRQVGLVSYGLYLYHWPVFLTVDTFDWGRGAAGAVVKLVTTGLLAAASFHLLEQPVRRRRPLAGRRAVAVAVAGAALLVGVVVTADAAPQVVTATEQIDPEAAEAVGLTTSTVATAGGSTTLPAAGGPAVPVLPTVLLVGDSTAASLGAGLVQAAAADPGGTGRITVNASGACGLVRGGDYQDEVLNSALKMTCPALIWQDAPAVTSASRPMFVVVLVSLPDTWERSWDGGATWADPAESEEFRTRLATDYAEFAATMVEAGAGCVLFLRPPVARVDLGDGLAPERSFTDGSQEVVAAVVDDVAADPQVGWVDFGGDYETGRIHAEDGDRPDGIHFSLGAAQRLGDEWFWPLMGSLAAAGACPDGPV
ncbi:MAG: acyltransferase [Ilumatobacter sp.]|nr:acyltransferase [Ilumatobacter sp.]MCB0984550.1 acyltransferase [Ilumatobacter sp.]